MVRGCTAVRHTTEGLIAASTDSEKLAPIKPELLELATDFPKPPSFDPTPEELAAEEKSKAEAMKDDGDGKDSSGRGKMLGGAKAPKWLKGIGGKK
jgi:tether containing UBX domain for GLUT4